MIQTPTGTIRLHPKRDFFLVFEATLPSPAEGLTPTPTRLMLTPECPNVPPVVEPPYVTVGAVPIPPDMLADPIASPIALALAKLVVPVVAGSCCC